MDWEHLNLLTDFVADTRAPTDTDQSFHIVVSDDEILSVDGVHP